MLILVSHPGVQHRHFLFAFGYLAGTLKKGYPSTSAVSFNGMFSGSWMVSGESSWLLTDKMFHSRFHSILDKASPAHTENKLTKTLAAMYRNAVGEFPD